MSPMPPSPLSPLDRPRAPTPSQTHVQGHQDAFSTVTARRSRAQQRSISDAGTELVHALSYTPPSSRPQSQHKSSHRLDYHTPPMPDTPAFFRADPYPNAPPSLTSSMSGSTSTRSSAYTSPGSTAIDHARVAMPGSDEYSELVDPHYPPEVDKAHYMLDRQGSESSHENGHAETSRWSESYTSSTRSRASSWVTNEKELKPKQSYDWHVHDEREEDDVLTTDDEAEHDEAYGRAAAVALAEEGRGLIVHGQGVPVSALHIAPGTPHLMLAISRLVLISACRHDPSAPRLIVNSQFASSFPHAGTPQHQQYSPCARHIRQLPCHSPTAARIVR